MPSYHPADPRPAPDGVTLAVADGEPLRITNFRNQLAETSNVKDRGALVRAATNHGVKLDEDALHALARALTDPGAVASMLRQGLMTTDSVGPVDVTLVQGHAWLTELLVLVQPRAGGYAYSVDPPKVIGVVGEDGPEPMLEIRFRDEDHLRALIKQTVVQTKSYGTDYSSSILSKRVSRPLLTHIVLITFEDGSDSFVASVVRDGISRVVGGWQALEPNMSRDELAEHVAAQMTARRPGRGITETAARARGREAVNAEMRSWFTAGTTGETPDEASIRVGQTFTMPVQVVVGVEQVGVSQVADVEMFDDTIQAIIASIHGEFKPWETGATQSSAIMRAIPRAVHTKNLAENVAAVATGAVGLDGMADAFGAKAPQTALWRAVYLLCWLGHPAEYEGLKRELKALLGLSALRNRTYASHLATLVDGPWRRAKAHSERQARRAWANGGALPGSFLSTTWDPVPVEDFLDLVEDADAGNVDARRTLQVAGGVALIADKLLMSNTGSAMESGVVPFRADVDTVIEGLATTRRGLSLLAHAANAFDPDRQALNSFTRTELNTLPDEVLSNAYVVPLPAVKNPEKAELDKAGNVVRLKPWDVVAISDPVRFAVSETERVEAAAKAAPQDDPRAQAEGLRRSVASQLEAAASDAVKLVTLATKDGAVIGGAFGSVEEFNALEESMRKLQLLMLLNPATGVTPDADDGTDDEDDSDSSEDE